MKRARHTEEQIIQVLQEAQAGAVAAEVCRRHGISQPTFYKWKQKFGGLQVRSSVGGKLFTGGTPTLRSPITKPAK